MIAATCIAIFLIPVTFTLFERLSAHFTGRHKTLTAGLEPPKEENH